VKLPSFAENNRQQFILDECKYHWFFPEEAKRLVGRLELIVEGENRADKMVDKRLIWIIEAAKQRRLEFL
jgi:hypothetical protein